jgi:hypothetical protein
MPTIEIDGRTYELVERHRPRDENDSRIYKGFNTFVRIGPAPVVEANLTAHKRLANAGFPVAHILRDGTVGDERFFIEESLGERILRLEFADEVKAHGEITADSFDSFVGIIRQYLEAQAKLPAPNGSHDFFERMHVARLCDELPELSSAIEEKAEQHFKAISAFPFVVSHGDLSPNNMLSKGVIDLEDSLSAPFGYDAVSALTTCEWFPEDVEFEFPITPYHFTQSQRAQYLSMCDEVATGNNLPSVSANLDHLDFFRAVWLTEGMAEWPKTKRYRHERFIREYLRP